MPDRDSPPPAAPAGTLLLVDDSPVNLGLIVDSLEARGHEVLVARDGEEALHRAEIANPDLVVLDVMMPGTDGFEVCRRLKRQPRTREIPVIFMTALSEAADKMRGFAAGGVDYITKPLDVGELRARIDTHLALRALRRELEENNRNLQREIAERARAEEALREQVARVSALNAQLDHMAFYDALTDLPNRALFGDRLQQALTEARWHGEQVAVMVLDLDHFKVVNDGLGHPLGDALLRDVALRLQARMRGYDTVARLGGDEFAILLPEIRSGEDLGRVARKLLGAFALPFSPRGNELFISASVGIALFPDDGGDADELIRQADAAMFLAKRSGRDDFRFCSKDLTASANERLHLESDLRRGIERDELELHFQPKVALAGGEVIGAEALLRWRHPERGMVPPDTFIGIAEDSGLIVGIGAWVLHEACRVAGQWNTRHRPARKVAINLSARQFQPGDLLEQVRYALRQNGCRPEWIELEITERLLLDEQGNVLETLNALRTMGITIAIDDFGTGYSSLGYLSRYPIDVLKIDRSFVGPMTDSGHHLELVKAMISIARCLGQQVVAEGVESAAQAELLESCGCQMAQGYFFARPMERRAFLEFTDDAETTRAGSAAAV